jgi:hypothetical protein
VRTLVPCPSFAGCGCWRRCRRGGLIDTGTVVRLILHERVIDCVLSSVLRVSSLGLTFATPYAGFVARPDLLWL